MQSRRRACGGAGWARWRLWAVALLGALAGVHADDTATGCPWPPGHNTLDFAQSYNNAGLAEDSAQLQDGKEMIFREILERNGRVYNLGITLISSKGPPPSYQALEPSQNGNARVFNAKGTGAVIPWWGQINFKPGVTKATFLMKLVDAATEVEVKDVQLSLTFSDIDMSSRNLKNDNEAFAKTPEQTRDILCVPKSSVEYYNTTGNLNAQLEIGVVGVDANTGPWTEFCHTGDIAFLPLKPNVPNPKNNQQYLSSMEANSAVSITWALGEPMIFRITTNSPPPVILSPLPPRPPPSPPSSPPPGKIGPYPCPDKEQQAAAEQDAWRWTCDQCMRLRCTTSSPGSCAARAGYSDPSGAQSHKCACGCCRVQCGRIRGCIANTNMYDNQPAPPPSPPSEAWRWSCGMCQRHRCTLYGDNKCAARHGFEDPQGKQLQTCSCACCRIQCARAVGCDGSSDTTRCDPNYVAPPSPPPNTMWRFTCAMCQRHRCSPYGSNKCAAKFKFADPQGEDLKACSCACCGFQCSRNVGCSIISNAVLDEPAATLLTVGANDGLRLPAALAVTAAVLLLGGLAALSAWRATKARLATHMLGGQLQR